MICLTCPKCRFTMDVPEHGGEIRPICPECHRCLLEEDEGKRERRTGIRRRRKGGPVVAVRPGVIRNLILGTLLLFGGPALIIWASSWPSKAGPVSAVFIGHGLVFCGWGVVLLIRAALRKSD